MYILSREPGDVLGLVLDTHEETKTIVVKTIKEASLADRYLPIHVPISIYVLSRKPGDVLGLVLDTHEETKAIVVKTIKEASLDIYLSINFLSMYFPGSLEMY